MQEAVALLVQEDHWLEFEPAVGAAALGADLVEAALALVKEAAADRTHSAVVARRARKAKAVAQHKG